MEPHKFPALIQEVLAHSNGDVVVQLGLTDGLATYLIDIPGKYGQIKLCNTSEGWIATTRYDRTEQDPDLDDLYLLAVESVEVLARKNSKPFSIEDLDPAWLKVGQHLKRIKTTTTITYQEVAK